MATRKKATGKKRGPKPFSPSKVEILRYWRMKQKGWRDVDIAEAFGVGLSTFQRAKQKFGASGLGKGGGVQGKCVNSQDSDPAPRIGLTPRIRRQLILLSENGLTKEKSADIVGISGTTLWKWFKIDPTLKHDMETAKERAVQSAINALRSRVLGSSVTSVTETLEVDQEGVERVTNRSRTTRQIMPSVTAIKLYLSNMAGWVTDARQLGDGANDDEQTKFDILKGLHEERDEDNEPDD